MKRNRILVVDDNSENLYFLRALLQGNDYEVATANNGVDALEYARQKPPDLVISDILMPKMDGFALCRQWKQDEVLKVIPFIFYTATYTDERDRQFGLRMGAEQYIVKPQEPEEFMAIVKETLRQAGKSAETQPHIQINPPMEEAVYLKQYNEVLIRKLEAKMVQLERVNLKLGQDISERTRELLDAQAELEQTKRLADIGALAETVAHELRSPLTAIKLAAYNIRRKAKDPEIEDHLKTVEYKVNENNQIINNLLFYSRIQVIHPVKLNICEIIKISLKAVKEQHLKKKTTVRFDCGPVNDIEFMGDRFQIEELLTNILSNAYDAVIDIGGSIEIDVKIENKNIIITIKDNGEGIPKVRIEHIFDPFKSTKAKGTGVGLAISRRIVKLHKGTIDIESEEHKGTTVTIILPVAANFET